MAYISPFQLPPLELKHLAALTDDTGLLQHAIFRIPRREEGYCVDDNARALLLMTLLEPQGVAEAALGSRYLAFVQHAFNPQAGRFRNFMAYDRRWLETAGSEDSHGRTLWALGTVAQRSGDPGSRALAVQLFRAALPAVEAFPFPRAWAFTLLGLQAYLTAFKSEAESDAEAEARTMAACLANRLLETYRGACRPGWHWFEDRVTYSNARLPQALLLAGTRTADTAMADAGLEALEWLTGVQTVPDGTFAPVGSDGFFPRGGPRAAFDQQPVDTCAMVSACMDAWRVTGEPLWAERARWAFDWFLGGNQHRLALCDPLGGCRDGLEAHGMNENQGAESTLSFLLSQVEILATSCGS